jgi:filamentous hemagglutinin family protein
MIPYAFSLSRLRYPLLSCMVGAIALFPSIALAQVIPDDSLGAERSTVRISPVNGRSAELIEGGARRGANLFHSFVDFDIGEGQQGYFANPNGVERILSRVTGSSRSDILGTLGVLGNADLFFLNPNGIVFGPNAALDVRGSFVGSTADGVVFDDGFAFSASNPQALPLLTVNVPAGLQYGTNIGTIDVQGATLFVPADVTLALLGGEISLNNARLRSPGGRVELFSIAAPHIVAFERNGSDLGLSLPADIARGDVTLTNGSTINVRGNNGGSIAIHAHNFRMLGDSALQAGISAGLGFVGAQAGTIDIRTTGAVSITENSFVSSALLDRAVGNGGDINITARLLAIDNGQISNSTLGLGNSGNIRVQVTDAITLNDRSRIDSSSRSIGNGGTIALTAGSLNVLSASEVTTATLNTGNAGNISVNVNDAIVLNGNNLGASIRSLVVASAEANAGNIFITTGSLSLIDSGLINSITLGRGDAGRVVIRASGDVLLDATNRFLPDTGIFSFVFPDAIGNGNDIDIQARSLTVLNGAAISANTRGRGNAGNISIQTTGPIVLSRQNSGLARRDNGIFSSVFDGAIGNGGSITLRGDSLTLANSSVISTTTRGQGDAGPLSVRINGAIDLSGSSGIINPVGGNAVGNGSIIDIRAQSLALRRGSQLVASTNGTGNAGRIVVRTSGPISLSDPSTAIFGTVNAGGVGNGGAVDIQAQSLAIANEAFISTEVFRRGRGNAGPISVRVNDAVTISGQGTGIFSSVNAGGIGNGGAIQINASSVSLNSGAQVAVSTDTQGDAGTITVIANTLDARQGSQILSTTSSGGDARTITLNADTINLTGQNTGLLANTTATATGQGGNIAIATRLLTVRDQARIAVNSLGSGQAGAVEVEATNARLSDRGSITAETVASQGGNITLRIANALRLSDRSEISASTATGAGGRLTINVNQAPIRLVELDRSLLATRVTGTGGEAGDLVINAARLSLLRRSEISASNLSSRNGGNIQLTGLARLQLDNSTISASTQTGQAGNVIADVANGEVQLRNRARLSVEATQGGTAGSLRLTANQVTIDSRAIASVSSPQGRAGNLIVNANTVRLDQGQLSAETGNSRSNRATAGDRAEPNGALIQLQDLEQLVMRNNSLLSARATDRANGGNIQINAPTGFVIAVPAENSDIIASAERGNGGQIGITTQGIFGMTVNESPIRIPESEINASSEAGIAGTISIDSPNVDVEETPELPNTFATPPLAQGCRASSRQNRFVNAGRGGVPRSPTDPLTPNTIWQDLLPYTAAESQEPTMAQSHEELLEAAAIALSASESEPNTRPILEAQGWVTLPTGTTALVTEAALVNPDGIRGNMGDRCFSS